MVMFQSSHWSRTNGFTVLEVLIGIGLFGIIMPSILLSVVQVNRLNDKAKDLTQANILAEQKMETLRSAGFNALNIATVDFTNELSQSFTEPRSATYTVTSPYSGIKEIEVVIQYNDQGQTRTLSYKSLIGELGVAQ